MLRFNDIFDNQRRKKIFDIQFQDWKVLQTCCKLCLKHNYQQVILLVIYYKTCKSLCFEHNLKQVRKTQQS